MRSFLKDWVLPPKILSYIQKQSSLLKFRKMDLSVIKKNKTLKNKHKGKRCFILGNAPTIKNIDLKLLENEYVFVMSTFYNHPDYKKLKKTFFSSVHLTGSKKEEENLLWMKAISDNTMTTNTFFFDMDQKEMIEEYELFENKNIFYIASANVQRSFNLTKITRRYETNIIQALEIAMYMGFKEIYLHSVNMNEICNNGKYEYFFNRKLLPYKDPYVNDDSQCKDFFIQMEATAGAFKALKVVNDYAKNNNISIFITNQESLLKFFTYKPFLELIK